MSNTTFSGPVRAGTQRDAGAAFNVGNVVLSQTYDTGAMLNVVGNVDTQMCVIPAGSIITDIVIDQVVASLSGTTTVSIGNATGGAQLAAAVATTAGGRFRGVTTAATQLAWLTSATADTAIFVRNATGTLTLTAGRFVVTILYIQK